MSKNQAKQVNKKWQMTKNISMNLFAFIAQFIINFYIAPKIVSGVGTEAYGFIGLANDFTSYASVITTVFNSVAARFIATAYYNEDYEKASGYFNSLIMANLIMAGIFGLIGIALVPNLDYILEIPEDILFDVKLTFALVFGAYVLNVATTVFTTATFVSNRTDMQGVRNIIQQVIRFGVIIIFLNFISIKLYWVSLATLIAYVVVAIWNISLTKVLTPNIKISLKKYAKKSYVFTLAKSGGWMAFTNLSNILMSGLDLIITNLFIGAAEMGLLSVARSFSNQFSSVISTIAPLFTPVFVAFFAKNQISDLVDSVKKSIVTMALILFVPLCGFIVFSTEFYTLWQTSLKTEEIRIVTVLSTVTIIQSFFNATTATMAQLSVVVNKLKLPVFVSFGCGLANVALVFILLNCTSLGVYAIVISSTVIMVLRYVLFNSLYAAWCLGQPKTTFIWTTIKTWLSIPFLIAFMCGVKYLLPVSTWGDLILDAVICAVVCYLAMVLVYNRAFVIKIFRKIFKK